MHLYGWRQLQGSSSKRKVNDGRGEIGRHCQIIVVVLIEAATTPGGACRDLARKRLVRLFKLRADVMTSCFGSTASSSKEWILRPNVRSCHWPLEHVSCDDAAGDG